MFRRSNFAGPGPFFRWALVLCLLATGCRERSLCSAEAIARALRSARPGSRVLVGRCRVEGVAAEVPEDVTLAGTDQSVLVGTGSAPVVDLGQGAILEGLRIETRGSIGVRSVASNVSIRGVVVHVDRGIGVALRGDGATLVDVAIEGPSDLDTIPPFADPDQGAYGLVVIDAADVSISDLVLSDVGPWGGIIANSTLSWNGGSVRDVVGTGVYVEASTVTLTDLTLAEFTQGLQPLPAYGVVLTNGATATTSNLDISGADLGMLHDAASGTHVDLASHDNRFGGVWVQRSDDVVLTGGVLMSNGVTGIASVASSNVTLDNVSVVSSITQLTVFGETAAVETGDGVQIIEPRGAHTLRSVVLDDHPRIGVLIDLGPTGLLTDVSLIDVSVTGVALGCLAQEIAGLIPLGGWDDDVTRLGPASANDVAQTAALSLGGSLGAANLPNVDERGLGL